MALQKQEVSINLASPLNTKIDEKVLPQQFVAASENVDYDELASCRKRTGLTQKSVSTPGADLTTFNLDVLGTIDNKLYTLPEISGKDIFTYSEGEDEWQPKETSRPCSISREDIFKGSESVLYCDSDLYEYGGNEFAVYVRAEPSSTIVYLEDVATGVIKSLSLAGTVAGTDNKPMVRFNRDVNASISDMVIFVTYCATASTTLDYIILDVNLATLFSGSFATITTLRTALYDISEYNGAIYVYALTGTNSLVSQILQKNGGTSQFSTQAVSGHQNSSLITSCLVDDDFVIFYTSGVSTETLYQIQFDRDNVALVTSANSTVTTFTYKLRTASCEAVTLTGYDTIFLHERQADDPALATDDPEIFLGIMYFNHATLAFTIAKNVANLGNPSKIYVNGAEIFFTVSTFREDVADSPFIDYLVRYRETNAVLSFVSSFNSGKSIGLRSKFTATGQQVERTPKNLVFQNGRLHWGGESLNKLQFTDSSKIFGLSAYFFDLTEAPKYRLYDGFGQSNYHVGSVVTTYDGETLSENNFLYPPTIVKTNNSGGTLPDGTYKLLAVYESQLPNGERSLSRPSGEIEVVATGGGTSGYDVWVTNYLAGQKGTNPETVIALYATDTNGTVFYKVDEEKVDSSTTNVIMAFKNNVNITDNVVIYTTGGVLENSPLPPSDYILSAKRRIFSVNSEDPNVIDYTKQFIDGFEAEYSDVLKIRVDNRTQPDGVTALARLDEKIICFKRDRIFFFFGDGPNDTGNLNNFSVPELVTAEVGCVEPASVIASQFGAIFKSAKGIYLIDRGLNVSYIGAAVEDFNNEEISSATLHEKKHQVIYTTTAGNTLVYDYLVSQWSIYTHGAIQDSVFYDDDVYYLKSSTVFFDGQGYQDDGAYFPMRIITPWLKVTGIQDFGRVWRAFILGEFKSEHELVVKTYYDYNDTATDTYTLTPDVADSQYQQEIHLRIQKCEAVKFEIFDQNQAGTGESMELTDLTLLVGKKKGPFKLPSSQKN